MTKTEASEMALRVEKMRVELFSAANASASPEEAMALHTAETALWLVRKALNSVATGTPKTVGEFMKITESEV